MTRKDKNMVDDIVDKLMDVDMEPTRESMWWTNTYKTANEVTLKVGRELGDAVLGGWRFRRSGKGIQGTEKTWKKGLRCGWSDAHI